MVRCHSALRYSDGRKRRVRSGIRRINTANPADDFDPSVVCALAKGGSRERRREAEEFVVILATLLLLVCNASHKFVIACDTGWRGKICREECDRLEFDATI